jgi:hypothetical protein
MVLMDFMAFYFLTIFNGNLCRIHKLYLRLYLRIPFCRSQILNIRRVLELAVISDVKKPTNCSVIPMHIDSLDLGNGPELEL